MFLIGYRCKNCGHSSTSVWFVRCPICNVRTGYARCADCQYYDNPEKFWGGGCPKCAGTAILAGEGGTLEEYLPFILGISAFILVALIIFAGIVNIEKGLFGSSQLEDDLSNIFSLWYFWLSIIIGALAGSYVGFKIGRWHKIKQKAREIKARDRRTMPSGANKGLQLHSSNKTKTQKEHGLTSSTENKDRFKRKTVITPIEISDKDNIKIKIKELLSELPIIEHESISECRQKMINQSGSIHPSMYIGSLKKTVRFVISMIQETENFILSCKGVIKVEKAFVISTWPTQKPVLEIQYEQFWDNGTSNVYSEHVMRIGSDEYEVFGSEKSNERMKTLWVEDAKVICISCKAEMERTDQYCPKCGNINETLKEGEFNNDHANKDDWINNEAKIKGVNENDSTNDISSDKLSKNEQDTDSLADELIKIAIAKGFLIDKTKIDSSDNRDVFNDQCRNKRAIEIGELLNELGGMELMRNVYKAFQAGLYETHKQDLHRAKIMARELEWVWDGIGEWQG